MTSRALWLFITIALASSVLAQQRPQQDLKLSPLVTKLINDPIATEDQKRQLMIFHGQWDKIEPLTPAESAELALGRFDLHNDIFKRDDTPALARAQAALWRGEPELTVKLLENDESMRATLVRAEALDQLGRLADAVKLLQPLRDKLELETMTNASELVAATEAFITLARLEGRPAQDYHLAMRMLAKARQDIDRLYWPALIAESKLLAEKHNGPEARKALLDALRLNLSNGEAWYMMGSMASATFNFEIAGKSLEKLRSINKEHLLADMLEVRLALQQKDYPTAQKVLDKSLKRYPKQRELLALQAATYALKHDAEALQKSLDAFEKLAPNSPLPYHEAGGYLSYARQYDDSAKMLREAIKRRPSWPAPRVELGLMLMQDGDEKAAFTELKRAVELDPFNVRAGNQLQLVEALLGYEVIRTEHFIIKYKKGIDAVLARDMADQMEEMYDDVTEAFEHKPKNMSLMEIMPNADWFAVRITGIPDIWTIAACTGDVVAMTPPREGKKQKGFYDWYRVIKHEYTHTVTLDQTANRIPHWFTEACAVSQEPGGRDYNTCKQLAAALHGKKLFKLETINWGFIRPKRPGDRGLAYAQAHWMLEYLETTYGKKAKVDLLRAYHDGVGEIEGIKKIIGLDSQQFMTKFLAWANEQVTSWGLGKPPEDKEVAAVLKAGSATKEQLDGLLKRHPNHPDLLLLAAQFSVRNDKPDVARAAIEKYAIARPVDPWSDRAFVQIAIRTNDLENAMPSMAELDRKALKTGKWGHQLAQMHRASGQLDKADYFAKRALHREPYNAKYRELAATIAMQRGNLKRALYHLEAMPLLEPTHAIHHIRLAAIYKKVGRDQDAHDAATAAKKINPEAKVDRFLLPDKK